MRIQYKSLSLVIGAIMLISLSGYAYTRNGYIYTLRDKTSSGVTMGGFATMTGRESSRWGEVWYATGGNWSVNGLWYTVDAIEVASSGGDYCTYLYATGETITDIIKFNVSSVKYVTVGHDNTNTKVKTSISSNAFSNCRNISSLSIQKSISWIGSGAFSSLGAAEIVCQSSTPPSISSAAFSQNAYDNAVVWVPDGALSAYRNSSTWGNFKKILAASDKYVSYSFNKNTPSFILENESLQLGMSSDRGTVPNSYFTFESSDKSIATIDDSGCLHGIKKGKSVISATHWNGYGDKFELTVIKPASYLDIIDSNNEIIESSVSIIEGDSLKLSAKIYPEDSNDYVNWISENPSMLPIDADGLLWGIKTGEYNVVARTISGVEKSIRISVVPRKVESITVNPKQISLEKNQQRQLSVVVLPENATDKSVFWLTKNNEGVIQIDQNGYITALKVGDADVIVYSKSTNLSDTCKVTVKPTDIRSIYFDYDMITMDIGETIVISPTVQPSNATVTDVLWVVDDPSIVSVSGDSDGIETWAELTALSEGDTMLKVKGKTGGFARCFIKVVKPNPQEIIFEESELKLRCNEPYQLVCHVFPAEADTSKITWNSSDENIATVSETGLIHPVSSGNVIISAVYDKVSAICKVRVVQPVDGVVVSDNELIMNVGEEVALIANVLPQNADNKTLLWVSDNDSVVNVDENGCVKAIKDGVAVVTVISEDNPDIQDECVITVIQPPLGIILNIDELNLSKGEVYQLEATVIPENAIDKSVNWASSDEDIVVVSPDGEVSVKAVGKAKITASTYNGIMAECDIISVQLPENLYLSNSEVVLEVGDEMKIEAFVLPDNVEDKTVVWSSSDEEVVTVNSKGIICANAIGTAIVTAATLNGILAECVVDVVPILVESIILEPEDISAEIGAEIQIRALILPDNATHKEVDWTSDNEHVATVDSDGVVKIVGVGNCQITVAAIDESEVCAKVNINGLSDVEDVFKDTEFYDIYTITGILIKSKCTKDGLKQILPDTYIFTSDTSSRIVRLK